MAKVRQYNFQIIWESSIIYSHLVKNYKKGFMEYALVVHLKYGIP